MSNTNNNLQTQTLNALHNAIMEAGGKDRPPMLAPSSSETTIEGYMENYKNVSQDIRDQLNAKAEAVQIILTGIDNDIYSIVDACPNECEMWKAIKRFYKMMNELVRNQCDVTNHQVIVQFLLQLQPEWKRFVTLVKQSQELKTISYHKLYDILKQHQTKVNELRAERLARTANPLALVAQQQLKLKRAKDAAYHKEKMLLCKQEEAGIQEVTPDAADNSGPIFDTEPLQKVQNDDDNYNVFTNDKEHPEQPKSVNDTYLKEQGDTNITTDSLDMCNNGETVNQDDDDLAKEHLKKFQAELDRYHDVNYASKVATDCAKAKGDLMSYKMESEKSSNEYTRKINDLNQTISDMKKELFAHQETISIMSQEKEAQTKFHETHDDKELEKIIALENKIKVLDDIVYKTGQSVQTMNMLNHNCKTSFVKP
ncbi:hypothetical protein Tco_0475886 [Tanacetum coccineum]